MRRIDIPEPYRDAVTTRLRVGWLVGEHGGREHVDVEVVGRLRDESELHQLLEEHLALWHRHAPAGGGPTPTVIDAAVAVALGVTSNVLHSRLRAWAAAAADRAARHDRPVDDREAEAIARWHLAVVLRLSAPEELAVELVGAERSGPDRTFEFRSDTATYEVEVLTEGGWAVVTRTRWRATDR